MFSDTVIIPLANQPNDLDERRVLFDFARARHILRRERHDPAHDVPVGIVTGEASVERDILADAFHEEADDVRDLAHAGAAGASRRVVVIDVEDDHPPDARRRHTLATGHGSCARTSGTISGRIPHRGRVVVNDSRDTLGYRPLGDAGLDVDATVWLVADRAGIGRLGDADRLRITGFQPGSDVIAAAIGRTIQAYHLRPARGVVPDAAILENELPSVIRRHLPSRVVR